MRRFLHGPAKLAWRIGILIVGLVVLLAGVIMIVTPGPAVVFIPLGLAILATEFQWARHILHRARPMIDAAIEKARRKKPPDGPTAGRGTSESSEKPHPADVAR